ncbi:MAG: cardiolipin synthase ClsB [Polaromonas sp.]|nr:cardiolipin synthase ClsB [Polaromonas sp.]
MKTTHKQAALQLLEGGLAFFPALIQAVDAAVESIQLETYIFDFHQAGADVAMALARAAGRGVKVRVMVDGIGTAPLPDKWAEQFRIAGLQWCVYSPLGTGAVGRSLGLLHPNRWRRLHRKLCVVDAQVAFCGGINVLDDFYDPNHGTLTDARFDFAVVVTGSLALDVADAMELLWWRVQAGYSARQNHLSAAWELFKAAGYGGRTDAASVTTAPRSASGAASANGMRAALVLRDNLRNRRSIEQAYRKAIGGARQEVVIANAYFLPGGALRRALMAAAKRGVRVTLLLQGKYEYFMQYHAVRPVYGALLAAGVEIHEYERSFLHAKVAVVDGHWATVGSSNLDPLSMLLAREANVVVEDKAFAENLHLRLKTAIAQHGRRVDPQTYRVRSLGQRLKGWLAYALMRLAVVLTGRKY